MGTELISSTDMRRYPPTSKIMYQRFLRLPSLHSYWLRAVRKSAGRHAATEARRRIRSLQESENLDSTAKSLFADML